MLNINFFIPTNRRSVFLFLIVAIIGTTISLIETGFKFGISNNVFHIPYVLRLSEFPIFYNDAFYQSIEKFTSLIWPLIRLISNEGNIDAIFYISHIISRVIAFGSLCWFFKVNGATGAGSVLISIIVCAVCPWMQKSSGVGGHGLFIGYFTHSEVTWGPLVAALVAAQLGRLVLAAVFTGIVFSINAFVGIWLIAILASSVTININQRTDWWLLAKASLTFLFICIPVAAWILNSINGEIYIPEFSYIDYIRTYYPEHFLIEATSSRDLRNLVIILYCGTMAALLLKNRKFWILTLIICFTLIVIGSILPYIFNNKFIFNLHFLRIAGVLQFIAIILIISASTGILMESKNGIDLRIAAVLAIGSLMFLQPEPLHILICAICLSYLTFNLFHEAGGILKTLPKFPQRKRNFIAGGLIFISISIDFFYIRITEISIAKWMLIFIIIFFSVKKIKNKRNEIFSIPIYFLILAFIISIATFTQRKSNDKKSSIKNTKNIEMIKWVRESQLNGPFLFPVKNPYREIFNEFQLQAQKTVWVDWKQGAAVMWAPSFYWQWMPRFSEVNSLETAEDFIKYAKHNKIKNIIFPRNIGDCRDNSKTVFNNDEFVICSVDFN